MSAPYKHSLCRLLQHSCCLHRHHYYQHCPHAICTHIYPLQVAVWLRRRHHSIVGVDDRHDIHAQQLLQCAIEVLSLIVIMEIQIGHKDLTAQQGGVQRCETEQ